MARSLSPYRNPPLGPRERTDGREPRLPERFLRWTENLRTRVGSLPAFTYNTGTPEGNRDGQKGDLFFDTTANVYYIKTSDTGNTGWIVNGSGTVGGSGVANQVAFWSGASTLTGDVDLTFDGTDLTVGGNITTLGIDDNATGERFMLTDTAAQWGSGVSANTFALHMRSNQDGVLTIAGGNSGNGGGNAQFYGSTHATLPGDVALRSGLNAFMQWDESVGSLAIATGTGGKTLAFTVDSNGDVSCENDLTVDVDCSILGQLLLEGGYSEDAVAYTTGTGTKTLNVAQATCFFPNGDLGTDVITFAFSNIPASGRMASWSVELEGADGATLTWPAAVQWTGNAEPTWTAGTDWAVFWTRDGGTIIYGAQAFASA